MKAVLNVGGNSKKIALPDHYQGWKHDLLDIDPSNNPDIVCDARELETLEAGKYHAVYCSHTLEHFYHHDLPKVLRGFCHVLKNEGFAEIRVPNLKGLMYKVAEEELDIDDILYQSPAGPIAVRDVVYGYGREIEQSGNDFFAHKTGFSPKSLIKILKRNGLPYQFTDIGELEIHVICMKQKPGKPLKKLFSSESS